MDEWWFDELEVEEAGGGVVVWGGDLVLEEGQVIWWHWLFAVFIYLYPKRL